MKALLHVSRTIKIGKKPSKAVESDIENEEGELVWLGEPVQPLSEHLFSLWLAILAGTCPSQTWYIGPWPGPIAYAPVATVGGSPMVKGVKSGVIVGVGVAIYEDRYT